MFAPVLNQTEPLHNSRNSDLHQHISFLLPVSPLILLDVRCRNQKSNLVEASEFGPNGTSSVSVSADLTSGQFTTGATCLVYGTMKLQVIPLPYLEVFRQQQFAGAQEAEDVAEDVSFSVNEVVLLQTVQHDGLGAVEQTTDPAQAEERRR